MTVNPRDDVIWLPDLGAYASIKPWGYDAQTVMIRCEVLDEEVWRSHRPWLSIPKEEFVALNSEEERFRSFAERYVIERAPMFRKGMEQEDAWAAMLDAKGIYSQIKGLGAASFGTQDSNPGQAATQAAPSTPRRARAVPAVSGSQLEAILAAANSPETPKRGSLAKLKAAARRIGLVDRLP